MSSSPGWHSSFLIIYGICLVFVQLLNLLLICQRKQECLRIGFIIVVLQEFKKAVTSKSVSQGRFTEGECVLEALTASPEIFGCIAIFSCFVLEFQFQFLLFDTIPFLQQLHILPLCNIRFYRSSLTIGLNRFNHIFYIQFILHILLKFLQFLLINRHVLHVFLIKFYHLIFSFFIRCLEYLFHFCIGIFKSNLLLV